MSDVIDIVGHFGTTFSYATVGSAVANELASRGHLGSVVNLDPEWHEVHEHLRSAEPQHTKRVFVVSVPSSHMEMFPAMYGRRSCAIFMSPNTDRLSQEHTRTLLSFGFAMCPSAWCAEACYRATSVAGADATDIATCWLGVDETFYQTRLPRIERLRARLGARPVRVLHVTTDQAWPGRKGTEELLEAWAILYAEGLLDGVRLHLHVPPALQRETLFRLRDLGLDQAVDIAVGRARGSLSMLSEFDKTDLVIAPSRCEGFGIMLASALVAGVPLACTYTTGQRDFLNVLPGWFGLPAGEPEFLAGEEGDAPSLRADLLAEQLRFALLPEVRREQLSALENVGPWDEFVWRRRAQHMADRLVEWFKLED